MHIYIYYSTMFICIDYKFYIQLENLSTILAKFVKMTSGKILFQASPPYFRLSYAISFSLDFKVLSNASISVKFDLFENLLS